MWLTIGGSWTSSIEVRTRTSWRSPASKSAAPLKGITGSDELLGFYNSKLGRPPLGGCRFSYLEEQHGVAETLGGHHPATHRRIPAVLVWHCTNRTHPNRDKEVTEDA